MQLAVQRLTVKWTVPQPNADGTGLAVERGQRLKVSTKVIGIGILAAGLAAAGGGYLAVRQPAPIVVTAPPPPAATLPPPAATSPLPAATLPPPATPPAATSPLPAATLPPPATPPAATRYVPDLAAASIPAVTPPPVFDEVIVERHSVIGIRLDHAVSSKTARVEDRVSATVSRDVTVQGRVAIAEGARLEGTIISVDSGGKFRERPRLGLRFDTMILTDGTRLSIKTDAIYREGDSPSADATAKVGAGAVAGAILGAVLGGKKGAAIGGAAGAAGGAATVMKGDGEEVAMRAGAPLTVRLVEDLTILIQR